MDERIENQEIYCHDCGQYVQFPMDLSLNGNHVLKCPNCGHEHCRVVKDGVITGERWGSRNGQTYWVSPRVITTSVTSTSTDSSGGWNVQWGSWGTSSTSSSNIYTTATT